jgi:formylglycine-generating enzyme required for sulfatase activity
MRAAASEPVSGGSASAWDRLRSFARKYGKPAGFAAKLALQSFVPGAPLLAELAEHALELGVNLAYGGPTPAGVAGSGDIEKLAQCLGVLQADMGGILERVAALHDQPDRAREVLTLARATNANARAAVVKLDALASRFDRVEHQNDRILQGQEELLILVREVAAGRPAAPPVVARAAARLEAPSPAALPMIDSREVARREQRRWLERLNCEPAWTNDLGMRFRLIPPGRFRIGASDGDPHASADERPGQTIVVPAPLHVATLPLTAAVIRQFLQTANADDGKEVAAMLRDKAFAYSCRRGACADDVPSVEISARDAVALCGWMSRRDGRRYRLPTEAEWEYFARAGATGLYWWEEGVPAASRAIFAAAAPAAPDERRANGWGLCDPIGNVAEWTCSEYGPLERGFAGRAATGSAATLTVRGGSWRNALVSTVGDMPGACRKNYSQ